MKPFYNLQNIFGQISSRPHTTDLTPNGGGDCKGNGTPYIREIQVGEI